MRSRMIREGSVGLLILLGLGLFALLVVWLRGFNPRNRTYRAIVDFADVGGMQVGAPVRYRGVTIGRTVTIRPGANVVSVEIEIASADIEIPKDSTIEANQAGLIGETSVDITPNTELPSTIATNPLAANCQGSVIVCNGDRLPGTVGVNFNELISSTIRLTNLITDPEFFGQIRSLTANSSDAAASVAVLSREVTRLTRSVNRELTTLSAAATSTTTSVGLAADRFGLTATQINSLLADNRSTLIGTLNNLNLASDRLQLVLSNLAPVVEEGEFIENLETLSANAAQASINLRTLSESVGTGENLLLLQETLDSARATFQNAQKITADLDELTGDPAFRTNIRDLVNGLSSLVSSTQQLQQQTDFARSLESTATATAPSPDGDLSEDELVPASPTPAPASASPTPIPASPTPAIYAEPARLTLLDPNYRLRLQPYTVTNPSQEPNVAE